MQGSQHIMSWLSSLSLFHYPIIRVWWSITRSSLYRWNQVWRVTSASNKKNRSRNRKVIWFNPPYSDSVRSDIGAKFPSLINKHFGNSKLKQFFNPSTVKLPYSCMPNMNSIISNPNRKLWNTQYDMSNNSITNHLSQVQTYLFHPINLHQQHQHKLYLNTLNNIKQHLKRNVTAEGKIFVPLHGKCLTKSIV